MKASSTDRRKKKKPKIRFIKSWFGKGSDVRPNRDAEGMQCKCGGYAKRDDMTEAEVQKIQMPPYGFCGRPFQCCGRAFLCGLCNTRTIVNAHAPEAS